MGKNTSIIVAVILLLALPISFAQVNDTTPPIFTLINTPDVDSVTLDISADEPVNYTAVLGEFLKLDDNFQITSTIIFSDLTSSTTYSFEITACDAAGNCDTQSGDVTTLVNQVIDTDGDGVPDNIDNCPGVANPNQEDSDSDGVGNVCELDSDSDGVPDDTDNCPNVANPDQGDIDSNGIGDVCEPQPPVVPELNLYLEPINDLEEIAGTLIVIIPQAYTNNTIFNESCGCNQTREITFSYSQKLNSQGIWQTQPGDVGDYFITATATDSLDSYSQNFTITILQNISQNISQNNSQNISQAYCGDGIKNSNEECDGQSLNDKTCESFGFDKGALSCSASCTFVLSQCENNNNNDDNNDNNNNNRNSGGASSRNRQQIVQAQQKKNATQATQFAETNDFDLEPEQIFFENETFEDNVMLEELYINNTPAAEPNSDLSEITGEVIREFPGKISKKTAISGIAGFIIVALVGGVIIARKRRVKKALM